MVQIETALISSVGTILAVAVGYWLYRRKYAADIHKTESETKVADREAFRLEATTFLDLLDRVRSAQTQALADEREIARLQKEVEDCLAGHKDWTSCRDDCVSFLSEMEEAMRGKDVAASNRLLGQVSGLRARLESLKMS